MNSRSSVLVLGTALFSCFVIALCAALGIGGYIFFTRGNSVTNFFMPAPANQIVLVGNDKNIHVIHPHNGDLTALTRDGGDTRRYNYPTWSPDNQRIAFVGYSLQDSTPTEGALYTISPRGENLTPVFKTQENFPFYLYWSPDSKYVGFLSNSDSNNFALSIAQTDRPDSTQVLDKGTPFYWAWSPDSAQVFTHVGGTRAENESARLAFLNLQNNASPQPLTDLPGAFQAPQWTPDGKILFSTRENNTQNIALADAQTKSTTKLAEYRGRASFALAPDGTRIAYLVTAGNLRVPNFGPVRVMNADGTNARLVSDENALAFEWSPDSKKIAFLTIEVNDNEQNRNAAPLLVMNASGARAFAPQYAQSARIQFAWKIWDSATDKIQIAASFVPTASFLNVLPYFDQYANSSTFWSPDSQALVYTTREQDDTGSVWIADITGKTLAQKIGDGVLAFWSWK